RFGDEIEVVSAGDVSGAIRFGPQGLNSHDPCGLPIGQRLEQNGLYDAEDGRVGAYPECKSQHSDNEKYRLASQDTKGPSNVLQNHIRFIRYQSPLVPKKCLRRNLRALLLGTACMCAAELALLLVFARITAAGG